MGIAFPTIPRTVMGTTADGAEARQLSSSLLMDTLGVAMGASLGGASVALAGNAGAGLRTGLAGAFLLGLVCAVLVLPISRRLPHLPSGQPHEPAEVRSPGQPSGDAT